GRIRTHCRESSAAAPTAPRLLHGGRGAGATGAAGARAGGRGRDRPPGGAAGRAVAARVTARVAARVGAPRRGPPSVEVLPEHLRARRVAQLRQGLRLDLADPLPRHAELPADLLEGAGVPVGQAEAQLDDALLPFRQRAE